MLDRFIIALVLATLLASACSQDVVGPGPTDGVWSCEDNSARPPALETGCDGDDRFALGGCIPPRCDTPDGDVCCPGTFCDPAGLCKVASARITTCTADTQCDPGQECKVWPGMDVDGPSCRFPAVGGSSCDNGGVPFNGRCVLGQPCGGNCATGSVCNIDTNTCETPLELLTDDHGCDQSCGALEILVYRDPDSMLWDMCCAVTCECAPAPPLPLGVWGRFSSLALTSQDIIVSAYDATYGDLVVATVDKSSGAVTKLEYVDGVPTGGTPTFSPTGPRGGVEDPGIDVGQHTAIAITSAGDPRIAYYDVDNGNLKYAAWIGSAWDISVIDDDADQPDDGTDSGDVGRYVSLVLAADNSPHVSYFANRTYNSGELISAPVYARASNSTPTRDDWTRAVIEAIRSCSESGTGACTGDEVCVDNSGTPTCFPPGDPCACDCDQSCVDTGGLDQCKVTLPNRLAKPCAGTCDLGLSCVDTNGAVVLGLNTECLEEVALEDGCNYDDASGTNDCTSDEVCVNYNASTTCRMATPFSNVDGLPEGVGLFTSMVLDGDIATVVYYDRIRKHLRGGVAQFTTVNPVGTFVTNRVLCDPLEDFGQHSSLAINPSDGSLNIAFQGRGGETLHFYTTTDLTIPGTMSELVDDGIRGTSIHLVGAHASLAFATSGVPYIVYADQTNNDLELSYLPTAATTWERQTLLFSGGYGSFAKIVIDNGTAYVANYRRSRTATNRDTSAWEIAILSLP